MKYDLSSKPTKGAIRVLSTFSAALFDVLLKKPFDDITVNEICEAAGYPRATFYNYFDDKYDLLNYFWQTIVKEMGVEEIKDVRSQKISDYFFERIYGLCEKYTEQIKLTFRNNSQDSYFFTSCIIHLKSQIRTVSEMFEHKEGNPVPKELMVEHYCNTTLMIFEWRFLQNNVCSKEYTKELFDYLLKDL